MDETIIDCARSFVPVGMHQWAERDGTYDELVAQRSQALAILPSRQ